MRKTNAARILDGLGVPYEIRDYAVDLDGFGTTKTARNIGLPLLKTLLAEATVRVAKSGRRHYRKAT
jgi:Cys-tRNA(Pro)/Cys-tRNA(Cys) deacylase